MSSLMSVRLSASRSGCATRANAGLWGEIGRSLNNSGSRQPSSVAARHPSSNNGQSHSSVVSVQECVDEEFHRRLNRQTVVIYEDSLQPNTREVRNSRNPAGQTIPFLAWHYLPASIEQRLVIKTRTPLLARALLS